MEVEESLNTPDNNYSVRNEVAAEQVCFVKSESEDPVTEMTTEDPLFVSETCLEEDLVGSTKCHCQYVTILVDDFDIEPSANEDVSDDFDSGQRDCQVQQQLAQLRLRVKYERKENSGEDDEDEAIMEQTGFADEELMVISDGQLASLAKIDVYPLPSGGYPAMTSTYISHPRTVVWLLENYETKDNANLPRSTVYNHYILHCLDLGLEPVNPATFGKLIRTVFLGLRTRRLGSRGNSQYHYDGIQLKPGSSLGRLQEGLGSAIDIESLNGIPKALNLVNRIAWEHGSLYDFESSDVAAFQLHLGDPDHLKWFPDLDIEIHWADSFTLEDFNEFKNSYRQHLGDLLEAVKAFQFASFETQLGAFWRSEIEDLSTQEVQNIPKSKFLMLCEYESIQEYIQKVDMEFYQTIVKTLIPNMLLPMPDAMIQPILNFASCLKDWLTSSVSGYPEKFVELKLSSASIFSKNLQRHTSLNNLAYGVRSVLQNQGILSQMVKDLLGLDFKFLVEQVTWMSNWNWNPEILSSLEHKFKAAVSKQITFEQWTAWLVSVVDQILRPSMSSDEFESASHEFLLTWSFYSSLVIREMTLRNCVSFDSFHLLRLFYDEWMEYIVGRRVFQMTGTHMNERWYLSYAEAIYEETNQPEASVKTEDNDENLKGVEDNDENRKGFEDNDENRKGVEDNDENLKGVEDNDENLKGVEDNDENLKGFEDNKENLNGFEDNKENLKGFENNDENLKGFEDNKENLSGFEDNKENLNGFEDNKENLNGFDWIEAMIDATASRISETKSHFKQEMSARSLVSNYDDPFNDLLNVFE